MHASIIEQIKNHPVLFGLSIGLHIALLVLLIFSFSHTSAPKMPAAKKVDTVKAVIIDASVVEQEVQKLKRAEDKKRNQQVAQKNKLDKQAKNAKEQRKKEEKRLAELKKKEKQRQQAKAKKEKAERIKKEKQLAKLNQQNKELEKKRLNEQKKLDALATKRKAEEKAALDKKQAAEAEVRRQAQEVEMRQQMLEEERRLAKQSAENQKLLSQYLYQIVKKVGMNWNPPASMTAGWSCEIIVEQNRFGEVQNVQMKQCSGSDAFKSTVERAVRKSSPLPEAPNNDVFDKRVEFIFRPDV